MFHSSFGSRTRFTLALPRFSARRSRRAPPSLIIAKREGAELNGTLSDVRSLLVCRSFKFQNAAYWNVFLAVELVKLKGLDRIDVGSFLGVHADAVEEQRVFPAVHVVDDFHPFVASRLLELFKGLNECVADRVAGLADRISEDEVYIRRLDGIEIAIAPSSPDFWSLTIGFRKSEVMMPLAFSSPTDCSTGYAEERFVTKVNGFQPLSD
ncbi:hypothetical protein [Rhizobium giardinii]|uniref:hypothetical protein n=1 Tax=Rhizobium giardinii TaxID=56731 RepID=UPI0013AFAF4A